MVKPRNIHLLVFHASNETVQLYQLSRLVKGSTVFIYLFIFIFPFIESVIGFHLYDQEVFYLLVQAVFNL